MRASMLSYRLLAASSYLPSAPRVRCATSNSASIMRPTAFGPRTKGVLPVRKATTPLQKAQDLMYDAWEAVELRDRVRIAKEALAVSPDCADAYVLLAGETARSPQEAADLYAKGVAAGERALGKQPFTQDVGDFWGILETRPYMRARLGLAEALWLLGKRQEALAHVRDMLRLNPNDNQGVRYVFLGWLLETGDKAQTKTLLESYSDGAASWLYGRALYTFSTAGDTRLSRTLLAKAQNANHHVPDYLLRRKQLPGKVPRLVGMGDENEAVICTLEQMGAWRTIPGALRWLAAHT